MYSRRIFGGKDHSLGLYAHQLGRLKISHQYHLLPNQVLFRIMAHNPSHDGPLLPHVHNELDKFLGVWNGLNVFNGPDPQIESLEFLKRYQGLHSFSFPPSLFLLGSLSFLFHLNSRKQMGDLRYTYCRLFFSPSTDILEFEIPASFGNAQEVLNLF